MQKVLSEFELEWGADLPRLSQMMSAMQAHRHQTRKAARDVSRTSTLLAASLVNSTLESVLRGAGLVWDEFRDDTGAGDFTPPEIDDELRVDPSLLASVKNAVKYYRTVVGQRPLDSTGLVYAILATIDTADKGLAARLNRSLVEDQLLEGFLNETLAALGQILDMPPEEDLRRETTDEGGQQEDTDGAPAQVTAKKTAKKAGGRKAKEKTTRSSRKTESDRAPTLRMLDDSPLEDESQDKLHFREYADALAGLMDHPDTKLPLMVAINAPWGAGKSTLAKMVQRRLDENQSAGVKRHVTTWFNAWLYDDAPDLAAAFAAHVAQAANQHRRLWRRVLHPIPSRLLAAKQKRTRRVLWGFTMLAITAVLVAAVFSAPIDDINRIGDMLGIDELGKLVGESYQYTTLSGLIIFVIAAQQVISALSSSAKSVARYVKDPERSAAAGEMEDVRNQLHELIDQATPVANRFIVFVDDLERCRPPRAVEVLEVANQLLGHKKVITVIMADMPAVVAATEIKYEKLAKLYTPSSVTPRNQNGDHRLFGRHYLQKIIQLQFDLPRIRKDQIVKILGDWADDPKPGSTSEKQRPEIFRLVGNSIDSWWRRATRFLKRYKNAKEAERFRKMVRQQIDEGSENQTLEQLQEAIKVRDFPSSDVIIREQFRIFLSSKSSIMELAESAVIEYLPPLPRNAKRFLNRLRLLVVIAHDRKMFGGNPELTPAHIGKWAVLREGWPELGLAITFHPEEMTEFENRASDGRKKKGFQALVRKYTPQYEFDDDLRKFLGDRNTELGEVVGRIVHLQSA